MSLPAGLHQQIRPHLTQRVFLSLPGHISHWAKDIDVMDGAIDVADTDTPDGPQFSSKMFWRGWDKGPWRAGADGLPVQPDPDELYDGLKYWAD